MSKYKAMLRREINALERKIKAYSNDSIEELAADGDILGPARLHTADKGGLLIAASACYCRFRKGDSVTLRDQKKNILLSEVEIREIRFPEPGVLHLLIQNKRDFSRIEGQEFFIFPNESTGMLINISSRNKSVPRISHSEPKKVSVSPQKRDLVLSKLNGSQANALLFIIENNFSGAIQGPPGTGKTQLLSAIVNLACHAGLRVGMAAFTHAAVDNALSRIADLNPDIQVIRSGTSGKLRKELYSDVSRVRFVDRLSSLNETFSVIGTTVHSWCLTKEPPPIDLLIIDEAGQVPAYFEDLLAPLSARKIYLGDHRQLPPVMTGSHGDEPLDIFTNQIVAQKSIMLETQYRMNKDIQEWSSTRYYNGKLVPHDSNAARDILAHYSLQLGSSPVQIKQHSGSGQAKSNPLEAKIVADIIEKLRKEINLGSHDFGIITPHRMQAGAICQELQQRLGVEEAVKVDVDTVERFQGQEREVILLSLGAAGQESERSRGGIKFLGDPRRLNVAITRAKSRFIAFASEELGKAADKQASTDSDLAPFLKWCGSKSKK